MGRDTVVMAQIKSVLEGQPPHDHTLLSSGKTRHVRSAGAAHTPEGHSGEE